MSDKPSKSNTKKTATKRASKKNSYPNNQQPSTLSKVMRWCFFTGLKLLLIAACVLTIYMIYLDGKVRQTFEGQRWEIPVQVFSEIPRFSVGSVINSKALQSTLQDMGYTKVTKVTTAGQFAASGSRLIIFRRAFDFSDRLSEPAILTIDVKGNRVTKVYQNDIAVHNVIIEPSLLARIVPDNKEDRLLLGLEDVPNRLIDTLLLVEDRDFYFHSGVSPLGIIRALYSNLMAGRTVQGGSTLTQQLVKNMFLTRDKTLTRKIKEALMALILEYRYSKDQLLEAYFNEVYLGQNYANGIYGFGLGANFYFGKTLSQLRASQIALLVGQVKGPSYYDPWRYPERAKERRDLILKLMFEQGYIDKSEFVREIESPLSVRQERRLTRKKYPAYMQLVQHELAEILQDHEAQSGIRVFTGFSPMMQNNLESTVDRQLLQLDQQYQQSGLQAAMVVTDIETGEIRALVGDRNSEFEGFNRALNAQRPIGSLIKPAVYIPALERYQQFNLATPLADEPISLNNEGGQTWQPKNYDGKYRGKVPLIDGLVNSLNIPTVNLGMAQGLENTASALQMLGYHEPISMMPSMLLGAINMSPLEVSQMYQPIAAHGFYQPIHAITRIVSSQGETLYQNTNIPEQRISENASYLLDYSLVQVAETGTAKSLTWRLPDAVVAGKTGTSNDLRDSWFVGYDEQNLVTTWVGHDDNKPSKLTGSSGALVLFADFMKQQGVVNRHLTMPTGIALTKFEVNSGNAVNEECKLTVEYPAVQAGISAKPCLTKAEDKRSWLEKWFGKGG